MQEAFEENNKSKVKKKDEILLFLSLTRLLVEVTNQSIFIKNNDSKKKKYWMNNSLSRRFRHFLHDSYQLDTDKKRVLNMIYNVDISLIVLIISFEWKW